MALKIDVEIYLEKIAQMERAIEEKRRQLASTTDPYVVSTLVRTLATLEELLSISRKTAEALSEIKQIEKRHIRR